MAYSLNAEIKLLAEKERTKSQARIQAMRRLSKAYVEIIAEQMAADADFAEFFGLPAIQLLEERVMKEFDRLMRAKKKAK